MAFMDGPNYQDDNLTDEMHNDINSLKKGVDNAKELLSPSNTTIGDELNNILNAFNGTSNNNDDANNKGSSNEEPKINDSDFGKLNGNSDTSKDNNASDKKNNNTPSTELDKDKQKGIAGDKSESDKADIAKNAIKDAFSNNNNKNSSDKADQVAKQGAKKAAKKGAEAAANALTGGAATAVKKASKKIAKAIKRKIILFAVKWISVLVACITIGVVLFVTLCPKVLLGLLSFQYEAANGGISSDELVAYKDMITDTYDDSLSFWDVINLSSDVAQAVNVSEVNWLTTYSYADSWGVTGAGKVVIDFIFSCPIFAPVNAYNNEQTYGTKEGKEQAYQELLQQELVNILEIGDWNPNDEFEASLSANYDLCMDLAKAAYKQSLKDCKSLYSDIKDDYDLEGYTIRVGPNLVLAKEYYSWLNSETGDATYEDLFVETNWGYVIATVDALVEANNVQEVTGEYDFNVNDYALYHSYLKDKEPIQNLYHIRKDIIDYYDDDGSSKKIVQFTVTSFSLYDLFHMSLAVSNSGDGEQGNDTASYETMDIAPETTWGNVSSYKDIVEVRVQQMRDELADEELIEKLGLNYEAPEGSASDTAINDHTTSGSIEDMGDIPLTIYTALTETYGYSPMAAATICGNIKEESGFNPGAIDKVGAHGFMQWQGNNWKSLQNYANLHYDGDWTNVECQIKFMCEEYLPGKIDNIESYSTLEGMVGYFALNAEKCSSYTYLFLTELEASGVSDNRSGGPCSSEKCSGSHTWSTICWQTGRYNPNWSSSPVHGCTDSNQYQINSGRYRYFEELHKYIVGGDTRYSAAQKVYSAFAGIWVE